MKSMWKETFALLALASAAWASPIIPTCTANGSSTTCLTASIFEAAHTDKLDWQTAVANTPASTLPWSPSTPSGLVVGVYGQTTPQNFSVMQNNSGTYDRLPTTGSDSHLFDTGGTSLTLRFDTTTAMGPSDKTFQGIQAIGFYVTAEGLAANSGTHYYDPYLFDVTITAKSSNGTVFSTYSASGVAGGECFALADDGKVCDNTVGGAPNTNLPGSPQYDRSQATFVGTTYGRSFIRELDIVITPKAGQGAYNGFRVASLYTSYIFEPVPEPGAMILLGGGLAALVLLRKRLVKN
jgi:hypothetical protein